MQRHVWIVLTALAALACLFAALTVIPWPTGDPPTAAPSPQTQPTEPQTTVPEPPPTAAPAPRSSVSIPRPSPKPSTQMVRDTDVRDADHTDDTDTFPAVQDVNAVLGDQMRSAMKDVTDELIGCLNGWLEAQPDTFEGRAVFAFHLDSDGLAQLDVLDVETIPEQTLRCLGDVLWEDVNWPAVDAPTDITWPIQVSVNQDEE